MNERRAKIMQILAARPAITMPELARTFHVTTRTIQNDVVALTVDYPLETQQAKVLREMLLEYGSPKTRQTLQEGINVQ